MEAAMIRLDEMPPVEAVPPKLTRRSLLAAAPAAMLAATACSKSSPTGSAGQGEVSLNYGLWDDTQLPAMKKIIPAFEKDNPHITVRTQLTPWESYWTKLQTAATAGT